MNLALNLFCLILFTFSPSLARVQPFCHDNERLALIHFKVTFSISKFASIDPSAYPKTESWNPMENEGNCCLWDGIACDEESGNVIELDLSSSFLRGFIEPNSTIFDLLHLQTLNLADNNFRHSLIPSKVGRLSNLQYLNLSRAVFSGQVPIAISNLSKLISLDLSIIQDPLSNANKLRLREIGLRTLVQNFTTLKSINLNHIIISSRVPKILANLTSLRHLELQNCELHGPFPKGIFLLPILQILDVSLNEDLDGHLPKFHNSSKLKILYLHDTAFSGKIPISIGNVGSLTVLNFHACNFYGSIPHSLGQLTKLSALDLSFNSLEGQIPISLANLTQLHWLSLGKNNLTGEVPSAFANLTNLKFIQLAFNNLHGSIPSFISGHQYVLISLFENNFAGPVEFDLFLKQTQLRYLQLSDVELIFPTTTYNNNSFPLFVDLALGNCNLTQFPTFLQNQTELNTLELEHNQIEGPLLIPSPSSLSVYDLAHNALSGEIPTLICNATFVDGISLEGNVLSGKIPPCLWNLSNSITMLRLDRNNLQGTIANTFSSTCKFQMINLAKNQMQGQLPRSLANCSSLEVLDLGNNLINDTFPSWLGALPGLQALALGSNELHGTLSIKIGLGFPQLRIIDISNNKLAGDLPNEFFLNLRAMQMQHQGQSSYMISEKTFRRLSHVHGISTASYAITIRYKGREIDDEKILSIFTSMDLSNNKFVGKISESIGSLVGLEALNLSHNDLIGSIPQSLQHLSNLEALDLSCNLLSGEIPQQLTKLTFLEILNVSYNQLIGVISEGQQFSTFGNDSFEGNTGLCGSPLSKKCGNSDAQSPPQPLYPSPNGRDDEESSTLVDWIIISLGYLSGLVVGVIVGCIFTGQKHKWFVETFGRGRYNRISSRR